MTKSRTESGTQDVREHENRHRLKESSSWTEPEPELDRPQKLPWLSTLLGNPGTTGPQTSCSETALRPDKSLP